MSKKSKLISISVFVIILLAVIGYLTFNGYADESESKPKPKVAEEKKSNSPSTKKEEVKEVEVEIKEGFEKEVNGSSFTILNMTGKENQVSVDILVVNGTTNEQFIAISKEVNTLVNEDGKNNVSVQIFLSKDGQSVAQFTFDNLSGKKQAQLNRTYTFAKKEIQYGRVDYEVVNATVNGATADVSVVASNPNSEAMFDISKELSQLVKEENSGIKTINISFFNSSEAFQSKSPTWIYTDNASTQISEKSSFGY